MIFCDCVARAADEVLFLISSPEAGPAPPPPPPCYHCSVLCCRWQSESSSSWQDAISGPEQGQESATSLSPREWGRRIVNSVSLVKCKILFCASESWLFACSRRSVHKPGFSESLLLQVLQNKCKYIRKVINWSHLLCVNKILKSLNFKLNILRKLTGIHQTAATNTRLNLILLFNVYEDFHGNSSGRLSRA